MIKIFKKIEWVPVYILALFVAISLFTGNAVLLGADGDFLIAGVNRGKVIGQIYPINLKSSETITGASKFGGWITSGTSDVARSGVTATLESSTGQGESMVFYLANDTAQSGTSIWVVGPAGDTFICESNITSGTSKIALTGTTMSQVVTLTGTGVSTWTVISKATPTIEKQ